MPVETLQPQAYGQLSNDLNGLSRRAVQANVKDPGEALELVRAFEQWTSRARKTCGGWSEAFHDQARELAKDLQSGFPAPQVMEQLLRSLLQAHRLLEKEQKGEVEKETDAPLLTRPPKPSLAEAANSRDSLYVRPEDQGLFQLFLQEVPTFLSGIQSNLLLLSSRQKADLSQVYQLFHVLKGQWGFLGFLQMRGLCQAAQGLLEPFLSGAPEIPTGCLDILLKALGSCRSQVDRIARGLPRDYVEVWDTTPVLWELEAQILPAPVLIPIAGPPAAPAEALLPAPPPLGTEGPLGLREDQMNNLLELLGDLMESQSSFLEEALAQNLKGKSATAAAHIGKVTRQLRDMLLSLRMVPLKPLLERLSWDVARFSQRVGKTVYLAVESPEIEVDRLLLERLAAALSQLLQNAVDHGIESAEERVRAGKLPEGMLNIKAIQQGGAVILEVEDDGRGLNLEKLRQRGRELGILTEEKASPARVMEMIFKPGVTTLEGPGGSRGQGLDQVEAQVEDLYGSIRVSSKPGQGCKFTLKVPRSPALIEGWVVEAAGQCCLLPLAQVRKISHPAPSGAEKEAAEDAAVPLVDLGRWLGEKKGEESPKFTVHLESGASQFRVRVEEVHGKQQVLVRTKEGGTSRKPGVREEALLPDGKPVLVLDTRQLASQGEK